MEICELIPGKINFSAVLNPEIRIRPIQKEDDGALASIIRKSLEEFGAAKPGTVYFDDTTDHLSELFKARRSAYFVAERDGLVLGGAGIFPTDGLPQNTCELVKMYLSPQARGLGLGKILLETCIAEAKKATYENMYQESLPELVTAIAMYRKAGFTDLKDSLGDSGHTGCSVWMIKEL